MIQQYTTATVAKTTMKLQYLEKRKRVRKIEKESEKEGDREIDREREREKERERRQTEKGGAVDCGSGIATFKGSSLFFYWLAAGRIHAVHCM